MSALGSIGEKLDLKIKQGSSFGPYHVTLSSTNNGANAILIATSHGKDSSDLNSIYGTVDNNFAITTVLDSNRLLITATAGYVTNLSESGTLNYISGGTHTANIVYSDVDEVPIDLTNSIIRGQIRKHALDTVITANLTISYIDRVNGMFDFGLEDATVTAAILTGEDIKDAQSNYVWDMELEDSTGRVIPLFYGNVKVFREVTRS